MIDKNTSNCDICFLVLARSADTLSALAPQVLPAGADISLFTCVYDTIAALLSLGPHIPAVLITRPTMLAKPHLPTILLQFPNLRTIGWLTAGESRTTPYIDASASQAMITVSTPEELANVSAALTDSLSADPLPDNAPTDTSEHASDFDPTQYRLTDEELDALLGAQQ